MAIKMRVLYASGKKKINNIANMIKSQYGLAFNSVDVIPPAYSCDKERIVILAVSAKGNVSDTVRLFCRELTDDGLELTSRFSAGYGDLSLEFQREIFRALDCQKNIGLTLNESLIMSPTKSITAIIGIKGK